MRTVRLSFILALLALFLLPCVSAVAADEAAPDSSTQSAEAPQVAVPPPAPAPVIELGRYRLFDGQYATSAVSGEQTSERHLFKLDSVTGNVWIGRQVQFVDRKSGRLVQQRYWEPFEQYLTTPQSK
ncbi:hypothetical protein [Geobacter argillaceus]|uniref:Uncharacterized protein n=1 Tax=Geobacter argillaceus TaxID=345631 RepID=A0A562VJM9_9BACT|nr:hypothetical protein [Geobacter argillaceus]TWJ17994.1 hypothetical protein JN12_02755 [Geobacter argillaceus]